MIVQHGRIKQLDGLRGLAIIFVLCFHFFNYGFLYPVFYFGWVGVDLFFVLSGFLITGILLDTKGTKGYYKTFIIRRALRILPLYYGVLLVFTFISPYSSVTNWFRDYQLYFWTHTSNILFLKKGFFQPLGHFWSLATEEQFYLVWPLLVWLTNPKQLIIASLFLIIVGIFIRCTSTAPYLTFGNPLAHMDGLLLGGICAVLVRKTTFIFRYITLFFFGSLLIFALYLFSYLILFGISDDSIFYRLPFTFTLVSILFSSLLVFSLKNKKIAKALSNRTLLFFGKYSYGMYVFNSIFLHYSNWAGVDKYSQNVKLIFYLGVFLLTILVSYLCYNLYEIRFLNLKNRFSGWRNQIKQSR